MIDDATLAHAQAVRLKDVLQAHGLLKDLKGRNGKLAGTCPKCGGTDRFVVNLTKDLFYCRGCQRGGDAIELVRFLDDVDFERAVETLAGPVHGSEGSEGSERKTGERTAKIGQEQMRGSAAYMPGSMRERLEREARDAAELRDKLRYCEVLWREAVPLTLTPAAIAYFAGRKIDIAAVPDHGGLRFHATCPFDSRTAACILGRFVDPVTNATGGIWRRPLSGIGPIKGRVLKLWPDADVECGLVIGEGVETVLAAALNVTYRGTLLQPAWACGHAGNLRDFPPLAGIESITILADNDANGTGQSAARECCHHDHVATRPGPGTIVSRTSSRRSRPSSTCDGALGDRVGGSSSLAHENYVKYSGISTWFDDGGQMPWRLGSWGVEFLGVPDSSRALGLCEVGARCTARHENQGRTRCL